MVDFSVKKFLLGYRFSYEAYGKNIREKATQYSLKSTEVLWDADGHELTQVYPSLFIYIK